MAVVGTSPSELLRRLEAGVARSADEVEESRLRDSVDASAAVAASERTHLLGMLLAGAQPGYLAMAARPGIGYGSLVTLEDLEDGELQSHQLMSSQAMDLDAGHVSLEAPLGQALLDRHEGDVVEVRTPAGARRFRIVRVRTLAELLDELEADAAAASGGRG